MADFGLFIGFGPPVRGGRERQRLAVFNEVLEYLTGLQQQGEIESFETVLLELATGGDLNGFGLQWCAATKTSW